MRRIIIAVIVVAVIAAGSWFAYQATAEEKAPPPPDYEVYTVGNGDLAATISATGVIDPTDAVNLSFRGTGLVDTIAVEVGDMVAPGDLLATLQTQDLELARDQALVGLRLANARVAQAEQQASPEDIAAAQAAVESARATLSAAQASYQDLLRGPTAAARTAAQASEERAKVLLDAAQRAYNDVAHLPNVGMLPQAIQLQQATIDYEVAKANVQNTLSPATEGQKAGALAQIAQAESAVVQAEAALARLTRGIAEPDLEILQAQVDQAEIAVKQADLALENTRLEAPIAAVVGAINIRENEIPTPGRSAIVLTDDSGYHVNLNVDEIDIGQLAVGQDASITVEALEDQPLTGVVSRIAPISGAGGLGGSTGIVTYEVRVDIDPTDAPLRPGLTATVLVTTDEARDVVLLPNRVMRLDRQTGETYVERLENGIPTRVNLVLGLRNEQFSEVLDGVEVGDELAVRRTDTGEALRQQFFGG
ncbi:MAG: efflux RND transporter periplasmic adaptor subunit [Caldilineales bacterium]|nr:efflux RND transporter periplasmic adaptor subunit [Caldilineales bacterium]